MKVRFILMGLMVASSAGAVTSLEHYDVNKAVEYIQTSPTQPSVPDRFQLEAFIQPVSPSLGPELDGGGATLTHSGGWSTTLPLIPRPRSIA